MTHSRLPAVLRSLLPCGFALAVVVPGSAHAAAVCSVASTALAFGTFSSLDEGPRDSESVLTVDCYSTVGSESAAYEIALGEGSAGSVAPRQLQSANDQLAYNLYTDEARSVVWGSGSGSGSGTVTGNLELSAANVTNSAGYIIFGRILAGQTEAHIGSYTDNVTITVRY